MSVDDAGVGSSDVRGIMVWGRGLMNKIEKRRPREGSQGGLIRGACQPGKMARAQLLTGRAAELGTLTWNTQGSV
jgi:hypothetical protein